MKQNISEKREKLSYEMKHTVHTVKLPLTATVRTRTVNQ